MVRIEKTIEVNVPVRKAYNQLTQFTDFPRFMDGVQEIKQLDDTHLHWHTQCGNEDREWNSEITEQVPDKIIAWRNISGNKNTGRVTFEAIASDKTKVTLSMECDLEAAANTPAEMHAAEIALAEHTEGDLIRFKTFIENQEKETGAWRGEIHNAQVTQPNNSGTASQGSSTDAPQAEDPASWLPKLVDVWEEPRIAMRKMGQEMDNLLSRFIWRPWAARSFLQGGVRHWPPVEVARRNNELVICADLPGIQREDVQVEIKHDKLTIEGDRRMQSDQPEQDYQHSERSYGHFYREILLPDNVDPEAAIASMHDGVLEITLPVTPAKGGRHIEIQAPR